MFDLSKIHKSDRMVCQWRDGARLYEITVAAAPGRNRSETSLNRPHLHSSNNTAAAASKVPQPQISSFVNNPNHSENIFTISKNLVRYWEKQEEELNEQVEYDLDDEDLNWLDEVNRERKSGAREIALADLAQMMDRLEKESFFQLSTTGSDPRHQTANPSGDSDDINEDALCSVCLDGECLANNVILFCDMCNLAVHQECYGVPYVPEGQWLCRRCIQSPSTPVSCMLCHSKNGAFKQTDQGQWVHMVCAIWVPEVHFANTIFLEPVVGIERIDKQRWRLVCYICRKRGGACIQCDKSNCYTAFHVTCAQQAGLYMKIREEPVTTQRQQNQKSRKKSRQQQAQQKRKTSKMDDSGEDDEETIDGTLNNSNESSLSATAHTENNSNNSSNNSSMEKEVRKCAYCDLHTPIEVLSPGTRKTIDRKKMSAASRDEYLKKAQKARMEKARRILAAKQNRPPVINVPTIPVDRIKSIAEMIDIDDKDEFLDRLISYWKMKRFSRNGVPLVRRLQRSTIKLPPATSSSSSDGAGMAAPAAAATSSELDQFFMLRRLRNDLERARLLIEMVKKREKIKREERLVEQLINEYETRPLYVVLSMTLDQLVALDTECIFTQPVPADVPDYYETIKTPMDLGTMRGKLDAMQYESLGQFEADLKLIISNCFAYNTKGDDYYNAGVRLKNKSAPILKSAQKQLILLLSNTAGESLAMLDKSESSETMANSLVDNLSLIENSLRQMNASSTASLTSGNNTTTNNNKTIPVALKELKEITTSCLNSPASVGSPASLLAAAAQKRKKPRR